METDYVIDVQGLVKTYDGKTMALDHVDLKVEAGKIFAMLGPNGAGKTTLMRILTTQLHPTSGSAYVSGLNVDRQGSQVRKLVSYIPQEMSVWTDLSGYENLLIYAKIYGLPTEERHRVINETLSSMGLTSVANNLASTYSGGMIRRLEIACGMLIKPKVLFMDEPTLGLDPSARKVVWDTLTSFRKDFGFTMFFNTHYMDEADLFSDEIAIIDRGKIIRRGTSDELKHSIGYELIVLGLEGQGVDDKFLSKIRSLEGIGRVTINDSELRVQAKDAETALPRLMEITKTEGISVNRAVMTKPTLDDVFLECAGTSLDDSGNIAEIRQRRDRVKSG